MTSNVIQIEEILSDLLSSSINNFLSHPGWQVGIKEKEISEAKLGDLVYYINEEGHGIMGVCNGVRAYFLCWDGGITARNINDCECCWSLN